MAIKINPDWEVTDEGTVKVRCYFFKPDNSIISEYLTVRDIKYHWEPMTNSDISNTPYSELHIDEGTIEHDNRCLPVYGFAPFNYHLKE